MNLQEYIDNRIKNVIMGWADSPESDPISDLVSFGELVDRLTICNLKLFKVKDRQADLTEEEMEKAHDLVAQDIALCKERNKIKRAIDHRLRQIIKSQLDGSDDCVLEEKIYGH